MIARLWRRFRGKPEWEPIVFRRENGRILLATDRWPERARVVEPALAPEYASIHGDVLTLTVVNGEARYRLTPDDHHGVPIFTARLIEGRVRRGA